MSVGGGLELVSWTFAGGSTDVRGRKLHKALSKNAGPRGFSARGSQGDACRIYILEKTRIHIITGTGGHIAHGSFGLVREGPQGHLSFEPICFLPHSAVRRLGEIPRFKFPMRQAGRYNLLALLPSLATTAMDGGSIFIKSE